MSEKSTTHESYGMIQINRFQGGINTYFGSSIKHDGGISISIHEADLDRDLSRDSYFSKKTLIEVQMSYNQFAEMLTVGMNTSGTPCTIQYAEGTKKEKPPFENKRQQFQEEFKDKMKEIESKLDNLLSYANELQSKSTVSKKDRSELIHQIKMAKQDIGSNLPFTESQFNKQIDKTIVEAKAEIEGFFETKIRDIGIEHLEEYIKKPQIEEKVEGKK